MDHQRVADLLGVEPTAHRAERAKAAFDVDQLIGAHAHRHEPWSREARNAQRFGQRRTCLQTG